MLLKKKVYTIPSPIFNLLLSIPKIHYMLYVATSVKRHMLYAFGTEMHGFHFGEGIDIMTGL